MKRSRADLAEPGALTHLIDSEGRLAIRVTPGARTQAILIENKRVSVKVRAKPQDGAANEAVRVLLAQALRVAPSQVELLRGATSREKLFRIIRQL
ncbi:DUF167 domain-containing protein [Erythrobacter aquimaris]|uniref:UPF0235 protein GRI34_11030 n=1 Tax=Qipengyuania aquimaris TaxID=255984 RepID=A0A6I4TNV4_9SPHN|nr:DUF167 domain-containing protein [Qipengyuania aquimaris]MXO96949.1 DUF167 domain-containing protein [Qipengyuania aquimaris]